MRHLRPPGLPLLTLLDSPEVLGRYVGDTLQEPAPDSQNGQPMISPLTATDVRSEFRARFEKSARIFRSPARVNIIGEHTDYNDGLVMPTNTALHTWLAITPRDDRQLRMYASRFDESVEVSLDDLRATPHGGWQEYPKGVLHVLSTGRLRKR